MIIKEILDSQIYKIHTNPSQYGFLEEDLSEQFEKLLIEDKPITNNEELENMFKSLDYFVIDTIPEIALDYIINSETEIDYEILTDNQLLNLFLALIPRF